MSLFTTLDIAASSMGAQRTRMNVAAMNMANASTTRTEDGGPYRRRDVVLQAVSVEDEFSAAMRRQDPEEASWGVEVSEVVADQDAPTMVFDPGHPDADARGYVAMPNVSAIKEMVNMMGAARAYEASTTVMQTVKAMAEQALRIGR